MKFLIKLLGPLILAVILYLYVDVTEILKILKGLHWQSFALCIATIPFMILARTIRWQRLLDRYSLKYSLLSLFRMNLIGLTTIMVIPAVGTFIRALYLKRDGYGIKVPVLSIMADKYFDYFLPLVFGTASVAVFMLKIEPLPGLAVLMLVALSSYFPAKSLIMFMVVRMLPKSFKKIFSKKNVNLHDEARIFRKALCPNVFALSIAGYASYYLSIFFLCKSLGINISYSALVLIETISTIVTLVPISFLGIGTRDIGIIAAFRLFQHTPEEAIALSMGLLLVRLIIVSFGAITWISDPPPLAELKQYG